MTSNITIPIKCPIKQMDIYSQSCPSVMLYGSSPTCPDKKVWIKQMMERMGKDKSLRPKSWSNSEQFFSEHLYRVPNQSTESEYNNPDQYNTLQDYMLFYMSSDDSDDDVICDIHLEKDENAENDENDENDEIDEDYPFSMDSFINVSRALMDSEPSSVE